MAARLAVARRPARLLSSRRRSALLRAPVAAAAAARGHLKVGARELDAVLIGLQLSCALTCPWAAARSSPKPTQPAQADHTWLCAPAENSEGSERRKKREGPLPKL